MSSLRPWLRGHWAMLFSHADDFACHDLESDRWLVVLGQMLGSAHVRPLALESRAESHRDSGSGSWVTQVGGASVTVATEEPRVRLRLIDLQACALRDSVLRLSSRFVMIIDEALRPRRTFAYAAGDRLPSPLDLAALAGKLRLADRIAA
jgi:hypothetical protein